MTFYFRLACFLFIFLLLLLASSLGVSPCLCRVPERTDSSGGCAMGKQTNEKEEAMDLAVDRITLLSMSLEARFPTSVVFSSYPRGSRSDGERYSKNSLVDPATVLLLLVLLLLLRRSVPSSSRTPFGSRRTGPFSFSGTLYREWFSPFPTLSIRPRTNTDESRVRPEQRCSLVTVYPSRQRGAAFEQSECV